MADRDHTLLLGEIKGTQDQILEHQKRIADRLDALDARLRPVERRAQLGGSLAGGLMAIGVTLLAEKLKKSVGM